MECRERMEQYFRENKVGFEVMEHDPAYTMPEVAASLHVPGKQVAKVVMVKADANLVMLAVPAHARLDFGVARDTLGAKKVSLAKEGDFAERFPDCATGAMPPFGNLYDVPVYVDPALAQEKNIIFRVGTHRHVMKIAYADFERLVQPTVGQLTFAE